MRDVAEKVIVWINKFKEIGDIAVSSDPVHAALPWAGVRFLLQVRVVSDYQRVKLMLEKTVVADSQQMGALLIGLDTITNFINRCRIYEILYLSNRHAEKAGQVSQSCLNLEVALVKLYAAMLQFLTSSNVLYDSNVGVRVVRALLEPNKVADFVGTCEKLQSNVDLEANNCDNTHSRVAYAKITDLGRLLGDLTAPIFRTDRQVAKLWERLEDSRRTKILTWASSIPYEDNHYTARQGHVSSTGEWLLKHKMYREWRGSSASMILWLHGIRKYLHCDVNGSVVNEDT
jgi:ankyrin repeat domain-containing protein 50